MCFTTVTLTHEVSDREEKIVELRHALAMLDQDHDQLVSEANKKDETIACLTGQLEQKGACLEQREGQLVQLRAELGLTEDSRKEREAEVDQVQHKLENTRTQLLSSRQQVDTLTRQLSQLTTDLNTMTQVTGCLSLTISLPLTIPPCLPPCLPASLPPSTRTRTQENQAVHTELKRALEETSSQELKLQDYAQSLQSYEETAIVQEQEKSELMESYNGLNSQRERLAATLQKMEGTLSATKMELLAVSKV